MSELPLVTVVMPVRNEERFIAECLNSVIANDYPRDRLEVLVVDGMSADATREIVEGLARDNSFIRLLHNPARIVPAALNKGIREAWGEVIVRMDGHTVYASDYIRQCVEALQRSGAASVGGVQRAVGTGYLSKAISLAVTTPFGIGDAQYRFAERETWVDTVFLGTWRKSTLEAVGGFNEGWAANEDYELNYRIRKHTGKGILLSPSIRCYYHVRSTLKGLAKQYFRYGFWKVRTLREHPESLRWRQLAPPAFVAALAISLGLIPLAGWLSAVIPSLYLAEVLIVSTRLALRNGLRYLFALPVVFPTVHVSWGAGFLYGLLRWGAPRMSLRTLYRAFTRPEDVARSERP
ncbi:MAG: glycosyltransferase family 2 protein [Chloroflexi bacterium]|nr:glycosyltransferase family 2 protein [Chloroflexota bacterium]